MEPGRLKQLEQAEEELRVRDECPYYIAHPCIVS